MKNIFIFSFLCLSLISCQITEPTDFSNRLNLAYGQTSANLKEQYYDFTVCYLASLYINADPASRDREWFAEYGKFSIKEGHIITDELGKYEISYNNPDFFESGAEYQIAGRAFTCIGENKWSVKSRTIEGLLSSKEADSKVTVTMEGILEEREEKGYFTLDYHLSFENEKSSFLTFMPDGKCEMKFYIGNDLRDWVYIVYSHGHWEATNSRD